MDVFKLNGIKVDSIDLKALLVSRGIKVSGSVYSKFRSTNRISPNPLTCNCLVLPDGTIVQMTDLTFHLAYLKNALSWDNLKQIKYFSQLDTPFSLDLDNQDQAMLYYNKNFITNVDFPKYTDFYKQKTSSVLPYIGNTVIQGTQWLSFQCL